MSTLVIVLFNLSVLTFSHSSTCENVSSFIEISNEQKCSTEHNMQTKCIVQESLAGKNKATIIEKSDSSYTKKSQTVSNELLKLTQWLTGYFSSAKQADTSSDKYHVDVRLRMRQIWPDSTNGVWIYVEQAYADDTLKPYRQRVYNLYEENGKIVDEVFGIENDSLYIMAWQKPELLNTLTDKDLLPKTNCGLIFKWNQQNGCFEGNTTGHDCGAGIPGVVYITSESEIYSNKFTSWDLGYDKNGKVVMGPFSPYIFDKISNFDCSK